METNDFSSNKGFGTINLEAIAQVRGERFNTNFSYSGFNGKNIVLTGRQKITSVTVQGVSRQSIRLECIFFTDSIKDGKLGSITLSAFSARQLIIGETEATNVVEGINQFSEREALQFLTKDTHFFRFMSGVSIATANFMTTNGRTTVSYDPSKPKNGYKYVIAELTDEQKAELKTLLASIRPTNPTGQAEQTGSNPTQQG